jgi:hypothetical protein
MDLWMRNQGLEQRAITAENVAAGWQRPPYMLDREISPAKRVYLLAVSFPGERVASRR